jgi:taurine dioxygenase
MITAERVTPALGAEVEGIDLSSLDDSGEQALYDELIEHQVLFLRDQHLAPGELVDAARYFGPLVARHHTYTVHPDHEDVIVLDWHPGNPTDGAEWHSDLTYRSAPPFASLLQAVVVPPVGGDTLWASMYAVHDSLDPGLRSDLEQLDAVHDIGTFRTSAYRRRGVEGIDELLGSGGSAVWPVIAHHPVTGRAYVNVNEAFTRWIIGLTGPESNRVMTLLFDLINRPDHQVRLRWRPGTIAIWDNRATQHYAVDDYPNDRRVMHRVVVADDRRADP